jgi:ATP-dependent protease ClpP protease subunit
MGKLLNFKDIKQRNEPFTLKAKGKKDKYAELVLYGEIGEDMWGEGITAKMVSDALKDFGPIKSLDVRINSMGGSVFEGVSIYNRLKQSKAKVTTYVDGLAASIASVIAMAGDEIVLSEGTIMMIHSPMGFTFGNQQDHENTIEILDTIEEEMIGIYARKTDLPRSQIRKMLKEETWMNSEEAIEMGFGTSVSEDADMVACSKQAMKYFSKHFKNMPKDKIVTDKDIMRQRIDNINNKIEEFKSR